jgi:hypothetical protein
VLTDARSRDLEDRSFDEPARRNVMSRRYPAVEGELEDELAQELENELENEIGGLVRELEDELEDEDFSEYEDELELEDELGGLARELEDELEDEDFADHEDEDEFEALVRELEDEFEREDEDFANPPRRVYADAELLAELAFAAEDAETEEEAEAFLGALAPLVIRAAAPLVKRYAPTLVRGAVSLGKKLWSSPTTRQLVRQVPRVLGRTVRDIGRRYAAGKPINAGVIARSLVGHAVNGGQPDERTGPPARRGRARRRNRPARGRSTRTTRTHTTRARRTATARRAAPRRRGKGRARRR